MQTEQVKCPNHPNLHYRRVTDDPNDKHIYFRSAEPDITINSEGKQEHKTKSLTPCSCNRNEFATL